MADITLGKTQITVNKNGFGCLPVQRVSVEESVRLLRKARENGINFFDTARAYTDSEEKLGEAFGGSWDGIFLATKTASKTPEGFWKDLETSLSKLKRDYVDIYQFHNPDFCPKPGDGSGLYECMLEAKAQGKIRHIGITNHRLSVAHEAIDSGLYETLQFPFSYLSGEQELELTGREFKLLLFLARNPDIVFSREQLFDSVWGMDAVGDMSTVTVHVNKLRDKIEDDPSVPRHIQTVWGVGYRFCM